MLPVLDLGVVSALAIDLNSSCDALEVLGRFQADLPSRVRAIHDAVYSWSPDRITTALTSLHTHASTVGALRLYELTALALSGIDPATSLVHAMPLAADPNALQDLNREAALFTHAYAALCSHPRLLDPPNAG
ncbi:hypothetical protein V6S67_19495 [Arthrobacter sp. Soc17.1.1.1]|uniref:hypothetical protein n=1 Tax=Arthrobacter sp. Soc17.1.1.1 TaxID=3121277 RepID=UPI002FE4C8BF